MIFFRTICFIKFLIYFLLWFAWVWVPLLIPPSGFNRLQSILFLRPPSKAARLPLLTRIPIPIRKRIPLFLQAVGSNASTFWRIPRNRFAKNSVVAAKKTVARQSSGYDKIPRDWGFEPSGPLIVFLAIFESAILIRVSCKPRRFLVFLKPYRGSKWGIPA